MAVNLGMTKAYEQQNAEIATDVETLTTKLRHLIETRRNGGTGLGWGDAYNGLTNPGDTLSDGVVPKAEMQAWHAAADAILGALEGASAATAYIAQYNNQLPTS